MWDLIPSITASTYLQYNIYGLEIFQLALSAIQNERMQGAILRAIDEIKTYIMNTQPDSPKQGN
jgi:hypothetical protein